LVPTCARKTRPCAIICSQIATEEEIMPLDSVDRRMLAILQSEGRISNAALAERLHLSPSPCLRRLRALEREGLISGYRAVLDRAKLGLGLTVFVELKVDGHSEHTAAAISEAVAAAPEVISAHIVSGAADFLLEVAVPDLPAYERLLFGTLLRLANVADINSNFALRTVKPAGPLPL
jgi:Lrp/AsnC family transcriptional regulator, leucine-responsive regulatory protein